MTLGEGKKKVYELLDEYSSGGELTEDKDIELKLAAARLATLLWLCCIQVGFNPTVPWEEQQSLSSTFVEWFNHEKGVLSLSFVTT